MDSRPLWSEWVHALVPARALREMRETLRLDGGLSQQDDPTLFLGVVPGLLLQLPQRVQHLARGFSSGGVQADPGEGPQRPDGRLDTCLLGLLPVPSGRRPPPDSSSLRHSGQALGQSSQSSMLRVQIKMRFTRVQGCCEYGVRLFGMKGMLGGGRGGASVACRIAAGL